jgi:aryl-alcohol dehydrogenase-like predicted oxidoreductase
VKKRTLGVNGPEVSAIGLGCMAMSEFYGESDEAEAKRVIRAALERGITMLDTADTYGFGHNEKLIADALKDWSGEVFVATKFGIVRKPGQYERRICGRPEYVRQAAEASLQRLGRETIDLYYIHRIDADVPIEDTVEAMSDLVREGKIRYIGICEPAAETVRRAHAVHPVAAVQTEYSLWTRHVEQRLFPTLRELGIGFIPYSPLGRGFLTGKLDAEALEPDDFRRLMPRARGENLRHNLQLVLKIKPIADDKGITLAQLALSWLMSKGEDIVPIPGTRRLAYLEENIAAVEIRLSQSEMEALDAVFSSQAVQGERYPKAGMVGIDG